MNPVKLSVTVRSVHIRKLPSGNYRVIEKFKGQQRSGTAKTKEDAKTLGAELRIEMGLSPTTTKATLRELLDAHLKQQGYAATTLVDLRRIVDKLPEEAQQWTVSKIEPVAVEGLYRQLARDGWTPFRVEKLHMLFSSSWGRARRYGWAKRNIMVDVDRPKVVETEHTPPATDDVRRILAAVDGSLAVYLRVAATIGARRGEVVGLQWRDFTIEPWHPPMAAPGGTIVVRRSVSHVPGHDGPVITDGKTGRKGHRVVAIDPTTTEMLRAHRDDQLAKASVEQLRPVWIFSHDAGITPWRGDYISREFRHLRDELGIPIRLHDLRHYMATTMLKAGIPLSTLADRLGHSSGTTTQAVYSHYVPASDQAAAATMENVIAG